MHLQFEHIERQRINPRLLAFTLAALAAAPPNTLEPIDRLGVIERELSLSGLVRVYVNWVSGHTYAVHRFSKLTSARIDEFYINDPPPRYEHPSRQTA